MSLQGHGHLSGAPGPTHHLLPLQAHNGPQDVVDMLQVIVRVFDAIVASPKAVALLKHYKPHMLVSV